MQGEQFGNYKFLSILGEGGMATVYLAENTLLGKKVAIKLLKDEFVYNSNIRGRFLAEARSMVQVSHANIISVLDLIDAGDIVAIVMEYVSGKSLKEYLQQKGKLKDTEIQTLFIQILTALQHVHNSGLVHRDIKPSNFMITDSGMIKLADFGIAKDKNRSLHLTETGTQMGTPKYMSPEQIKSAKDVDHRSDIYSLGVVLFEMVTGYFPFETASLALIEIQERILFNFLPQTYTKWDQHISKATSKNETHRYQSCKEWLDVIMMVSSRSTKTTQSEKETSTGVKFENGGAAEPRRMNPTETIIEKKPAQNSLPILIVALVVLFIGVFIYKNSQEKTIAVGSENATATEIVGNEDTLKVDPVLSGVADPTKIVEQPSLDIQKGVIRSFFYDFDHAFDRASMNTYVNQYYSPLFSDYNLKNGELYSYNSYIEKQHSIMEIDLIEETSFSRRFSIVFYFTYVNSKGESGSNKCRDDIALDNNNQIIARKQYGRIQ
jgi:serine/threonine protein kinase